MSRVKQTARKSTGGKSTRFKTPAETKKEKRPYAKKTTSSDLKRTKTGKRHFKPGQLALKEIRTYQKSTTRLIPRAAFCRVVKELAMEAIRHSNELSSVRITAMAMEAMQEAAEAYIVGLFEDAQLCTIHARRVTVFPKDLALARRLRGEISYRE
mmetsp:Transcript_2616/g.3477  ORF Transcript_2616/g.3477 Transcript_2616/m.3477 type:complete len:155 (-) Transcript_2616:50-514(-)|eukprot:CAMPEP_0168565368 /NCGR_PEP_ID=MMETSP0413-20121227/13800_1 /TAXON_ID=136452 /ORGANISM="Filamoeba nolandi, Strain NC-AS-23-1" /LENGTH=154 /DNA_ID=CAMNT_0008597219 /DNA_START=19 /DNA_END=483 /DNA_ORIENTATION=-